MGDETVLERILKGEEDPRNLPLALLQSITNDFSDDRKIGQGGFGEVYKGIYNGEEIAVKLFYDLPAPDNKQFENECVNLLRIRHPNIVRLLGYCYEKRHKHVEYNGDLRFAQYISRILCFEYLQGGSLDEYLNEESRDHDWPTHYNIIEGTCEGLNFLHEGYGSQILHLDLKPANILLDKYMGPKVADFGLSRFFSKTHTHVTDTPIGTEDYMPPEFKSKNVITSKNDVYSLGIIIIEIMAGRRGYLKLWEMDDATQLIELVITNWRERINATAPLFPSAELDQVETCIKIAIKCVDPERKNRPTVAQILDTMQETEKRFLEEWRNQAGFIVGESLPIPTKSGLRGGSGGKVVDIEEAPWRLHSVTISYQGLIDAFSFSYIDQSGKKRHVGPWGKENNFHKIETIRFGPSEFVEKVSGAYGSHGDNVLVMSLTFVTNVRTYGPFGNPYHQNVAATHFRFIGDEGCSIVGFHGRSASHFFSIGVYMYPNYKTTVSAVSVPIIRKVQISARLDEDDMLGIKPFELRLPSELREISCPVELSNNTANCIAFNIQPSNPAGYSAQPHKGIVRPHCKYGVNITAPQQHMHHADKFIVKSMKVCEGIRDEDITEHMFKEAVKVVDEVNLMVIYEPTKPQENCKSREDTNMPAEEVPEVNNACPEFFSWVTLGIAVARHQLLDQDTKAREQFRQLENDLWKLRTTVAPKMLDLIDRVEWQSHRKSAAYLLPHIKDAVYDAEDLLDELDYYAIKLGVEKSKNSGQDHMEGAFLQFYNSIKDDCGHFNKVKEIQGRLDHIYEQSRDLGIHQAPQKFDRSIRPETYSFSDEPQIFGREKELKQLLQKLGVCACKRGMTDGEERMAGLHVLPIVGLGGVGKTTIAQQICNDAKVNAHFDYIVWTCVSDDFDIKRLAREILRHLGEQTHPDDNLNILMTNLANCVKSKMFLLVLDDLWDDILKDGGAVWKRFCKPLEKGLQGSMILVTTRSSEVANLVGTMNHYELAGLSNDVFWKFFKLQAFGSRSSSNYPELEHIGKAILPKLKRSPLAAKTVGRLLSKDLNTTHWKYILESELWQLEQDATDILPALRLSYMYLPPPLKRCFSICAMYPKDHVFAKEVLCDIWVAHGYVQPQDASFCFDDLANRSFFQRISQQSDKFVIHDLIHDTAQLVSKDECFIIKHASDLHKIPSNVRHLSIFTKGNVGCSELKSICSKKKLRSLVCTEYYSSPNNFAAVIDSWFRELLKIRVLSFKLSGVTRLPESMGNSKHLRYLCLFGMSTSLSTLPSSTRCLHHLKTIEARECMFERFPQGFSDVISLQKIKSWGLDYNKDHSGRLCLKWPPTERISGEKQVQVMEELPHWNLQHLEIEHYGGASCPSWLRSNLLPRLRSLNFLECCNIQRILLCSEEVLDNVHHLEELCIRWCSSLTSIAVSEASRSVGAFSSLSRLTISCCGGLLSVDDFLIPDYQPALKIIRIESCPELTSLPVDRLYSLSCLEEMTIVSCPKLNTPRVMILPSSLKKLKLYACGGIETIDFRQLGSSPALEQLYIEDCPHLRSIGISKNVAQTEHVHISGCPELAVSEASSSSSVGAFSSLSRLTIIECGRLLSLDELLSPAYQPALERIRIASCPELTSLPVDRLHGFSCLEEMCIYHCPKLNKQRVMILPSSLKILWLYGYGGIETIDFRQLGSSLALEQLYIDDCPDLRSIGVSVNVAQTEHVHISHCPQLTEIQQPFMRN